MKEKFIAFLKEHNCYDQYIANGDEYGWSSHGTFNAFVEKLNPYSFVGAAFIWHNTNEGGLWIDIDDAWQQKLKEDDTRS